MTKAATRGDWNQVWDSFDKRQTAKGAVAAANEDVAEGEDMFARAGGGGGVSEIPKREHSNEPVVMSTAA